MWTLTSAVSGLILSAAALVATVLAGLSWWVAAIAVALFVAGAAALPRLRYRRWRYEIRADDLYFSKGALWLRRTLVPFDRIQYVETRQGPLDRLFSLHSLVIYTGAGRAGAIPGLDDDEAQSLRDELSRVSGAVSL